MGGGSGEGPGAGTPLRQYLNYLNYLNYLIQSGN